MDLHLPPQIVRALEEKARQEKARQEKARQEKARQLRDSLQEAEPDAQPDHSVAGASQLQPQDDWETLVLGIGSPCGVGLSDADLSSDGLYGA